MSETLLDYNKQIRNLPSINGHVLAGNKTNEDLDIKAPKNNIYDIVYLAQALAEKNYKCICKSGNTADLMVSKSELPTIYADILNKYNNCDTQVSDWKQGINGFGDAPYYFFYTDITKMFYVFAPRRSVIYKMSNVQNATKTTISMPSGYTGANSDSGNDEGRGIIDCGTFVFMVGQHYIESYGEDYSYEEDKGICLFDWKTEEFNWIKFNFPCNYMTPKDFGDGYIYLYGYANSYGYNYKGNYHYSYMYRIPKKFDITEDDIELLGTIDDTSLFGFANDFAYYKGTFYFASNIDQMRLAKISDFSDKETWKYNFLRIATNFMPVVDYGWEKYQPDYKGNLEKLLIKGNHLYSVYGVYSYLACIDIGELNLSFGANGSEKYFIAGNAFNNGDHDPYEPGWARYSSNLVQQDNMVYWAITRAWGEYNETFAIMTLNLNTLVMNKTQLYSYTDRWFYESNPIVTESGMYVITSPYSTSVWYSAIEFKEYTLDNVTYLKSSTDTKQFKIVVKANASQVDTYYNNKGYSPFFVIDPDSEKIGLPREKTLWAMMYVGDNYQDNLEEFPQGVREHFITQSELEKNITQVDSGLSPDSENPVQNKVIKQALDAKQDSLTIDSTLDTASENPVQNKAVATAVNTLNQSVENKLNGKIVTESPTTETTGTVGDIQIDITNKKIYVLTAITEDEEETKSYTWETFN